MNYQSEFWNQFAVTGNISDYLSYKDMEDKDRHTSSREGEGKDESSRNSYRNGIICDADGGI